MHLIKREEKRRKGRGEMGGGGGRETILMNGHVFGRT